MEILLATIGLGALAKVIEAKLEKHSDWETLESVNHEVQERKSYSGLESYS